jgi:hypothetical protein
MPLLRAFRPERPQQPFCLSSASQPIPDVRGSLSFFLSSPYCRDDADKMSNRVSKTKPKPSTPHPKTIKRDELLARILRLGVIMHKPCSRCEEFGIECKVSSDDSFSCYECTRRHEPFCDALGVTAQVFQRIVAQHDQVESDLEQAEALAEAANAKVRRLRNLKRTWLVKMQRAIARGLDSIEELEKLERKEAEEAAAKAAAGPPSADPSSVGLPHDPAWLSRFVFLVPPRCWLLTIDLVPLATLPPGSIGPWVTLLLGSTCPWGSRWSIRVPLVELLKFLGAVEIGSWLP